MNFSQKQESGDLIASLQAEKHWVGRWSKKGTDFFETVFFESIEVVRHRFQKLIVMLKNKPPVNDVEFKELIFRSLLSCKPYDLNDHAWCESNVLYILGVEPESGDPFFPDCFDMDFILKVGHLDLHILRSMKLYWDVEYVQVVIVYVLFIRRIAPQEFIDFIRSCIDPDVHFDIRKAIGVCYKLMYPYLCWRIGRIERRLRTFLDIYNFPGLCYPDPDMFWLLEGSFKSYNAETIFRCVRRYQKFVDTCHSIIDKERHPGMCGNCVCVYRTTIDYQRKMRKHVRDNGIYFKYPAQNAYIESLFSDIGYKMEEIEFGRKKVFEQHEKMVEKYTA